MTEESTVALFMQNNTWWKVNNTWNNLIWLEISFILCDLQFSYSWLFRNTNSGEISVAHAVIEDLLPKIFSYYFNNLIVYSWISGFESKRGSHRSDVGCCCRSVNSSTISVFEFFFLSCHQKIEMSAVDYHTNNDLKKEQTWSKNHWLSVCHLEKRCYLILLTANCRTVAIDYNGKQSYYN